MFVVVLNRESCFCRSVCIFVVLLEVGGEWIFVSAIDDELNKRQCRFSIAIQ